MPHRRTAASADTAAQAAPEAADVVVGAVLTASRLLVAVSARSLASVEESLTLPQFRMLVVLDSRGAMNLTRLAEHFDVNPSTALRMVDRLSAIGMVARLPNPASKREVILHITKAGAKVVTEVTERRRAEIARITTALTPAERANLIEALDAFARAGGEPPADPRPDHDW